MTICSAVNCHVQTEHGYRLFRFPSDKELRKRWAINCRRDQWQPNNNSRICELHFEDSEFEKNRADGWRKLKFNAVPTLFEVPNPPPKINENPRNSIYKNKQQNNIADCGPAVSHDDSNEGSKNIQETNISEEGCLESTTEELLEKIKNLAEEVNRLKSQLMKCAGETDKCAGETDKDTIRLQREIDALKKQVELKEQMLSSFLTPDQKKSLVQEKMKQWDHETIIKALKLRFNLGVHGYSFLRSTGYPIPTSRTLTYRFESYKISPGVLANLLEPFSFKISSMDPLDRYCHVHR